MPEGGPCEGTHKSCALCKAGEVKVGLLGAPHKKTGVRRVRGCKDPTAIGKRNRTKGKAKQRTARRQVGVQDSDIPSMLMEEESWDGIFRFEVKAGQQIKALTTRFSQAEAQSDAGKMSFDNRPFALVAMPDGWGSEGLVVVKLSTFQETILPALESVPAV